jgi:hypothetical protein
MSACASLIALIQSASRDRLPQVQRRKIHRMMEITIETMMLVVSGK